MKRSAQSRVSFYSMWNKEDFKYILIAKNLASFKKDRSNFIFVIFGFVFFVDIGSRIQTQCQKS
jgi:hypothetical protein